MKKVIIVSMLISMMSLFAFAGLGDLSLYGSFAGSGSTAGGLRIDLGSGFVADGTIAIADDGSGREVSTYSYFADIYYGVWGISLGGSEFTKSTLSLMYAVEQPVNDKVTLGIASYVASYMPEQAISIFNGYDIYVVLAL